MGTLKTLMSLKKDEWAGKVRIIALSIDQDQAKHQKAIADNGFGDFEHYNIRTLSACKLGLYFGIKKIPYCALLDKEGKVAYLGHPVHRQPQQDIEDLVAGKAIKGTGC